MAHAMMGTALAAFAWSLVLSNALHFASAQGMLEAMLIGLVTSVCFQALNTWSQAAWENRPVTVTAIRIAHDVISAALVAPVQFWLMANGMDGNSGAGAGGAAASHKQHGHTTAPSAPAHAGHTAHAAGASN
jgi:hypothetical protein